MDEIQRQANGALTDVFRPGVNLDLLQTVPSLMARHWLIQRDVLVEAGGYSAEYTSGAGVRPVAAPDRRRRPGWPGASGRTAADLQRSAVEENAHERQALTRHLAARGYRAQVSSEAAADLADRLPACRTADGVDHPPQPGQPGARCNALLVSVLQRTRYQRHEILIADNHSQSEELATWLTSLEGKGDRLRVLRSRPTSERLGAA